MSDEEYYDSGFEEINLEKFQLPIKDALKLFPLECLPADTLVTELIELMQSKKIGAVPLVEGDKMVGIVSERDLLLRVIGIIDDISTLKVSEVMTPNPIGVGPDTKVAECIAIIGQKGIRHLPVVDEKNHPLHMMSVKDLLNFIMDLFPNELKKHGTVFDWDIMEVIPHDESFSLLGSAGKKDTLSASIFMTPLSKSIQSDAVRVDVNCSLGDLLAKMQSEKVGAAVVTEYETLLRGIITERDFLLKIYNKVDLNEKVSKFMTPNPHTLLSRHIFAHAINNMFTCRYRNIILVNEEKFPLAIITLFDIFKYLARQIFPDLFQFEDMGDRQ